MDVKSDRHWVRLTPEALDLASIHAFLATPEAGAIDVFLGTTRRMTHGRETVELAYEAYEPMAVREMEALVGLASERWPIMKACLHHRLGVVPLAEASVIIGVATPHRADAFEACRYLIDTLKVSVPIWKKEHFADGTQEWVEGGDTPQRPESAGTDNR